MSEKSGAQRRGLHGAGPAAGGFIGSVSGAAGHSLSFCTSAGSKVSL